MKKLIVTANLRKIRALKYRWAGDDPCEKNHLLEAHMKTDTNHAMSIQEAVTDQAGRFARGSSVGLKTGMSYGEEHHLKSELDRAALEETASRIENILESEGFPDWILTAPQPILRRLEENLSPSAKKNLLKSVGADLTQTSLEEMEERFL